MSIRNYFAIATIFIASNAYSLTADTAKAIAVGEGDPRIEALRAAVTGLMTRLSPSSRRCRTTQ
jgi:hypothetical protein